MLPQKTQQNRMFGFWGTAKNFGKSFPENGAFMNKKFLYTHWAPVF
jgi:hypothetical protein